MTSDMIFIISDQIHVGAFLGHLPNLASEQASVRLPEAPIISLHLSIVNKMYCCILSAEIYL